MADAEEDSAETRKTKRDRKISAEDRAMRARSSNAKVAALALLRARIKARMAETGITAAKLAIRANVTPRMVQQFLADPDRDVHFGNVAAIAEVLLVDVRDLLDPLPDEWSGKAATEADEDG